MKNCLVVYYSRTGMTDEVAGRIAAGTGCDVERIEDTRSRGGPAGFLRCLYEALARKTPPLKPTRNDPANYELVILGTPVWAGRLSSPMRSYIEHNAPRFNNIAAFCTMGGTGGDKVLDEIATLAGKTPVARLALRDDDIRRNQVEGKIAGLRREALPRGAG